MIETIPKISVVMSVYNADKYLKDSIESILSQTFTDFEFIIINDGSTDKSFEILKYYENKDSRIKIISRENKGLIYSLNEGIKLAKGEYIARMDADDISYPDRFKIQLDYIKENNLILCGTWANIINEFGEKTGEMTYPPKSEKIKIFGLLHNPFIHSSLIFKKDIFDKVGGYNPAFKHIEDYELWTRIMFKYKTDNIEENLLQYRVHENQITKKNNTEMRLKGLYIRFLALFRFIF
jgi:glycosyltransferase involved in cell wall biosynthesis